MSQRIISRQVLLFLLRMRVYSRYLGTAINAVVLAYWYTSKYVCCPNGIYLDWFTDLW